MFRNISGFGNVIEIAIIGSIIVIVACIIFGFKSQADKLIENNRKRKAEDGETEESNFPAKKAEIFGLIDAIDKFNK